MDEDDEKGSSEAMVLLFSMKYEYPLNHNKQNQKCEKNGDRYRHAMYIQKRKRQLQTSAQQKRQILMQKQKASISNPQMQTLNIMHRLPQRSLLLLQQLLLNTHSNTPLLARLQLPLEKPFKSILLAISAPQTSSVSPIFDTSSTPQLTLSSSIRALFSFEHSYQTPGFIPSGCVGANPDNNKDRCS